MIKFTDFSTLISCPVFGGHYKLPPGVGPIQNLKLIDLNSDGIDDLVLITGSGILQIWFGQPDDSWLLSGQVFPAPVKDFTLFDFNKDGSTDMAIAGTSAIRTYFNNGSGTMSVSETVLPAGENKVIESDDLDNKGTSDVLVGNSEGTIIKVNDETGLTDEFQYLASGDTTVLLAADLTGNGRKEVITATATGENIIWVKDAEGIYATPNQYLYTWGTQSIKAIDINTDGCMDLVIIDGYDQEVIFINDCNGIFTVQ